MIHSTSTVCFCRNVFSSIYLSFVFEEVSPGISWLNCTHTILFPWRHGIISLSQDGVNTFKIMLTWWHPTVTCNLKRPHSNEWERTEWERERERERQWMRGWEGGEIDVLTHTHTHTTFSPGLWPEVETSQMKRPACWVLDFLDFLIQIQFSTRV